MREVLFLESIANSMSVRLVKNAGRVLHFALGILPSTPYSAYWEGKINYENRFRTTLLNPFWDIPRRCPLWDVVGAIWTATGQHRNLRWPTDEDVVRLPSQTSMGPIHHPQRFDWRGWEIRTRNFYRVHATSGTSFDCAPRSISEENTALNSRRNSVFASRTALKSYWAEIISPGCDTSFFIHLIRRRYSIWKTKSLWALLFWGLAEGDQEALHYSAICA